MVNPDFSADQIATWLADANPFRRARWVHWPDAALLAAELSGLDFFDRFTPHYQIVRQVRRITGLMRKLADAWDDPDLCHFARGPLISGTGPALSTDFIAIEAAAINHGEQLVEQRARKLISNLDLADKLDATQSLDRQVAVKIADSRAIMALHEDRGRFSRMLRQAADCSEWQLAQNGSDFRQGYSLHVLYVMVAETLRKHTGAGVSVRPTSPDARFVREVIEHAGLSWHPRVWRGIRTVPWERSPSVSNGRGKKS
jgi:hypothetical protein